MKNHKRLNKKEHSNIQHMLGKNKQSIEKKRNTITTQEHNVETPKLEKNPQSLSR